MATMRTIGLALIASVLAASPVVGQGDTDPASTGTYQLRIQVFSRPNSEPVDGAEVILKLDGQEVIHRTRQDTFPFLFEMPVASQVDITVIGPAHLVTVDRIEKGQLSSGGSLLKDFYLPQVAICPVIDLPRVHFSRGNAHFSPEGYRALVELAETLRRNPPLTVELLGHVDVREKETLALVRCEAVHAFLVAIGVHPGRLSIVSKGDREPLITKPQIDRMATDEEKEAAHAMNRRAEFRVLSFDWVPEQDAKPDEER